MSAQSARRGAAVDTVDLLTRWQLYLISASEPLALALIVGGHPGVPLWRLSLLVAVAAAHTAACFFLLRAGIAHLLGAGRPTHWLVVAAVALTAVGVVASVLALAEPGRGHGRGHLGGAGGATVLLFCVALTGAATPLLRGRRLLAAVVLPAVLAGLLQVATANQVRPSWAINYVAIVGAGAFTYRFSVWLLAVVWELDRSRDVQARLAVAEERMRFARDLHDVLGRNLALIAVTSDLAAQLERRGEDGAAEHMHAVRQIAQDSMREVREVVAGHRRTDLETELAGARSVLRSAGIDVRVIGDGAGLSRETQTAFGWVVREATTNIIRHSEATTVRIGLDGTAAATVLVVENDGVHPRESTTHAGAGLVGLRERLSSLGGKLTVGETAGGWFRVEARVPVVAAAAPSASRERFS